MRVPAELADAFRTGFETDLGEFLVSQGLIEEPGALSSDRFLSRSILPHVQRLSRTFNRLDGEAFDRDYWKRASNPANLRLAYFIYFMPANLFRTAAVLAELGRLGFRWSAGPRLRAIDFGAGPGSSACGAAAAEKLVGAAPTIGLPAEGDWAMIEADGKLLDLGCQWVEHYAKSIGLGWTTRPFRRAVDLSQQLLPPKAPRFNLWVSSFFLNEQGVAPETAASSLLDSWERHLEQEGLIVLVEPALKEESRRLLELRKALIAEAGRRRNGWFKILTPCLGHQACGALAAEGDWCHDEATWWRPGYYRKIDDLASLDRKTLPFSYLVATRSERTLEELLPALAASREPDRYRLVSPARMEGRDAEYYVCGQDGKHRVRHRMDPREELDLERGDVVDVQRVAGEAAGPTFVRFQKVKKIG